MTTIYLVRHCEAEGNVKRLFQGSTDCDISPLGATQLQFLAARFLEIPLDAVVSSPLLRARKTAAALAEPQGLPVQIEAGLHELHGGIFEGKPFAESFEKYPDLAEVWDYHPQDFAPPEGEPMREAYDRITACLQKIVADYRGKTVAVATHGGVIRCLMCALQYGTIDRLREVPWCDNTAITKLRFAADGAVEICGFNDRRHLPEAYCPKRSRISSMIGRASI